MKLRAPNLALFIIAVLLAIIGVWEHLGAPLATSIPVVALPMFDLTTSKIISFLGTHAFWVMVSAWVLLAIGTVLPHRARAKAEPKPAI